MSVDFDRGSLGKFDSRTLNRETLDRWTGRNNKYDNNNKHTKDDMNKHRNNGDINA